MEQFVRPVKIPSPISGHPVTPRLIEKDFGDKIVVEAHWIDPQSGAFIRKGIVEIRQKNPFKESWPDAGEMTPELLKGVRDEEKRARESQGYKPGGRWFGTYRRDDERYGVPSREEASQFYDDLESVLPDQINPEYALQDFLAYNDLEEGEIKTYIYEYDIADPEEQEYIIDTIANWVAGNY